MSKLRADEFVNSDDNGAPSFPHSATVPAPTADGHFANKLYTDTSASTKSSSITNTISNTSPPNPSAGDFWTNTSQSIISLNIWNGLSWVNVKNSVEISAGQIVTPPSISDPNGGYIPTMLTATSAVVSDATLSSSKWYKDDVEIPGATGLQFYATDTGTYKYEEIWVDAFGTQLFPSLSAVIDARAGVIDTQPTITSSNGVYSPTTLTATAAVVSNATLIGSKWYRDGVEIPGETGLSINILVHEGGIYKYEETWTDHFGTQLLPTLSASVQVFATIATPSVLSPADDTGSPDFDYTAESSAITNIVTTPLSSTELVDATIRTPHQTFSSSEANYNSAIWDPVNNKIVIAYSDGSNNYGKMRTANMHFDGNNYALQFSPEFTFNSSGTYDVNVVYAGNGKIVVSYLNTGENRSESKVGTYQAHLGQYSFGSPESITGSTTYASYMQSVYDPINDKVVISYNDGGDNNYGKLRVGTISGTSISYGSPSTFNNNFTVNSGIVHDPTTQKIVIAYKSGQTGKCRTATVSGTNISLGPAYEFRSSSAADWVTAVQDPNSDRIVFAYHNVNGFTRVVKVNSDDSFTFGPEQTFNSGYTHYEALTYHSPTNKIVLSYQDRGPGASYDHGKVITGSIDPTDNTITFNNPSKFNLDDTSSILYTSIVHETLYDKVAVFSRELLNGSYSGKAIVITDVGGPVQVTEDGKTLTLTDTTVSKVSDGSLIGGTTIDQVLTVGETVQADTAVATTVATPVFSTTTYSGTGSTMSISTGIDLTTKGLLWFKGRDGSGYSSSSHGHFLFDSERNNYGDYLKTSETDEQSSFADYGWEPQPAADGTISNLQANLSHNNVNWVNWAFRAAPGFFDIQTYTGISEGYASQSQAISHDLGSEPGMIVVKNLDDSDAWFVYHKDLPDRTWIRLNENWAKSGPLDGVFSPTQTSTEFNIGADASINRLNDNYVAYLFADTPGLIKCGSFNGGGSQHLGITIQVDTGFRPGWLMIKRTDSNGEWWMLDDERGWSNNGSNSAALMADKHSDEANPFRIWPTQNGFAFDEDMGGYSAEYVYIAIAANPEADIATQSTASGTVSASTGNTVTLSDVSGTWSTGMKVQGTDSDTKDNPDPINPSELSLTSSEPATTQGSITTWGNAQWQLAEDSGFTTNLQSLTSALTSSGTQTGPTGFTLDYNKNYYVRTKYGSSNPAGIFSNWSVASLFKTGQLPLYADDVFSTYLYTGNGSTQTIANGIDLAGEGGMVWIKNRDKGGSPMAWASNYLFDTARNPDNSGNMEYLITNQAGTSGGTNSDTTKDFGGWASDGFLLGEPYSMGGDALNGSGDDFVSWTFRKAPGFFDVVTWTGTNDGTRIPHNLGSLPGMIIVKNLDSSVDWKVYAKKEMWIDGETYAYYRLSLNNTNQSSETVANIANTDTFNPQSMGSEASGTNYIAYLFADDDARFGANSDESIIKCGTYVGDGQLDGPTIDLGWEPQWLMVKNATYTAYNENWTMLDVTREWDMSHSKGAYSWLSANQTNPESRNAAYRINSRGFQPSDNGAGNISGQTYIYMAIRRPHKPATVATDVFDVGLRSGSSSDAKTNSSILTDMTFVLRRDSSSEYNGISSRLMGENALMMNGDSPPISGWLDSGNKPWAYMTGAMINGSNGAANTGNLIDYSFKRSPGFFDVVTYVGNGSAHSIPHNLGVEPEMMWVKNNTQYASGRDWMVYIAGATGVNQTYVGTPAAPATGYMSLNKTDGASFNNQNWNSAAPTSTHFTVGNGVYTNESSRDHIAYLFATKPGISKVGWYVGSAGSNIDIDCGFTAGSRFVMIKRLDAHSDWYVWNAERGIVSGSDPYMKTNTTDQEFTGDDYIDPLNAGFTITSSAPADLNQNGGQYLFLAIA